MYALPNCYRNHNAKFRINRMALINMPWLTIIAIFHEGQANYKYGKASSLKLYRNISVGFSDCIIQELSSTEQSRITLIQRIKSFWQNCV